MVTKLITGVEYITMGHDSFILRISDEDKVMYHFISFTLPTLRVEGEKMKKYLPNIT